FASFLYPPSSPRPPHSFPTRRSSDLALNVTRMRMLGATVIPVKSGSRTLKDAINEALRDWVANVRDTHYLIGSVVGPHPFPTLRSEEHTSELQSRENLVCRLLLEKKK